MTAIATNIVIIGASGDLTRKKLIPALFSLYCNNLLPEEFHIYGYARSKQTDNEFRSSIGRTITYRYTPDANTCDLLIGRFLQHCYYCSGQYDDVEAFNRLKRRMEEHAGADANLLVYMAIPPDIFLTTAHSIRDAGLSADDEQRWSRVVIEKPFGRDTESSAQLTDAIAEIVSEEQTYRIDHYLGKEVIQNLLILRFGNRIFEPIWNRDHIESVSISFSEKIGVEGRAGYFNSFGIIRDVVQNHLLQTMALLAMEQPNRMEASDIAEEKSKLLRATAALNPKNTITGQYSKATADGVQHAGYLDDPDVPNDSITETYVRTVAQVHNPRWYGIPFYISAGKAIDTQKTEIIVRFRELPYSIFSGLATNNLLIRVQPNEAIELSINNKAPGMRAEMVSVKLNMLYHQEFEGEQLPEAYERLLLDVLRGDRSLFIQRQELDAAWRVVTPLLHDITETRRKPLPYLYGSAGPALSTVTPNP